MVRGRGCDVVADTDGEDIANAMLFLTSDGADWMTGQALVVDGGFSCV